MNRSRLAVTIGSVVVIAVAAAAALWPRSGEVAVATQLNPALMTPRLARATAPDVFRVGFETTQGDIILEVTRSWAPNGADRFYNLVEIGYFKDIGLIRVIDGFMMQFGLHGTPQISRHWLNETIPDDPRVQSNLKGTLAFAKRKDPDTRATQLFINFKDNKELDPLGFAPIGKVVSGLEILDKVYRTGEPRPVGPGPSQQRIEILGNDYLRETYPDLDYIKLATFVD